MSLQVSPVVGSEGLFDEVSFFGVYDGHNGDSSAELLKQRFHLRVSEVIAKGQLYCETDAQSGLVTMSPSLFACALEKVCLEMDKEVRVLSSLCLVL